MLAFSSYRGMVWTHNHYAGLRSDTRIRCLWSLQGPLIININFTQCYAPYYLSMLFPPLGLRKMAAPCQSPEGARSDPAKWLCFNQPVSVRPMNVQKINKTKFYPPHPGGSSVRGGVGVNISKVREISRTAEKIDKKKFCRKNNQNMYPPPHPIRRGGG